MIRPCFVWIITLALAAPSAIAQSSKPARAATVITLLHTNDLHGHVTHPDAAGGLARIATVVDRVRGEMPNVLLLDSGDIIQSTPAMRLFGGRPIIEPMNRMRYDAAVLGNHEFDSGADVLAHAMSLATFPWVSANVVDTDANGPWNGVKPYVIREVAGVRVAIFGLTTTQTVAIQWPRTLRSIRFDEPIDVAKQLVPKLRREERADLIVCLSHLGRKVDWPLATAVPDIDVILGGHSHTELQQQGWVGRTLIMQCRPHAGTVGRVDIAFRSDASDKVALSSVNGRDGLWWGHNGAAKPVGFEQIEFPSAPQIELPPTLPEQADVVAAYAPYARMTAARLSETLAHLPEPLSGAGALQRQIPVGTLIAEAVRSSTGADIGLAASSAIDPIGLDAGPVDVAEVYRLLGGYTRQHLVVVQATGAAVNGMLRAAVTPQRRIVQLAGVEAGRAFAINGQPIADTGRYLVAGPAHVIQEFFLGQAGVEVLYDDPRGPGVRDATIDYLRKTSGPATRPTTRAATQRLEAVGAP